MLALLAPAATTMTPQFLPQFAGRTKPPFLITPLHGLAFFGVIAVCA
jgi:hypothetical protein